MYLYVLTNKVNGKQYVGQSINHPQGRSGRVLRHFNLENDTIISRAIIKYGKCNFSVEVMHYPNWNQEQLNKGEQELISERNAVVPNGYNCTHGGKNGSPSEATKRKISEKLKGIKRAPFTKDHRQKLSDAKKGKPPTNHGYRHTEHCKSVMRQKATGRKHLSATKQKISTSTRGEKHHRWLDLDIAEIKRLYKELGSQEKVAKALGCSRDTIRDRLKNAHPSSSVDNA